MHMLVHSRCCEVKLSGVKIGMSDIDHFKESWSDSIVVCDFSAADDAISINKDFGLVSHDERVSLECRTYSRFFDLQQRASLLSHKNTL